MRLLHDARVAGGVAARGVLAVGNAEQDHAAQAEPLDFLEFGGQLVGRDLAVPRHRADRLPQAFARANEQRQDQIRRRERDVSCTSRRTAG